MNQGPTNKLVLVLLGALLGAGTAGGGVWLHAMQLQDQLDSAQAKLSQLQSANGQLQESLNQAQASLQQMQAERVELVKADLPVQVGFRHGFLSAGLILVVRNLSPTDLAVSAEFGRTGTSSESRQLVIPANGSREIGEREGWAFVAGDSIVLKNPNFREWRGAAPQPES